MPERCAEGGIETRTGHGVGEQGPHRSEVLTAASGEPSELPRDARHRESPGCDADGVVLQKRNPGAIPVMRESTKAWGLGSWAGPNCRTFHDANNLPSSVSRWR